MLSNSGCFGKPPFTEGRQNNRDLLDLPGREPWRPWCFPGLQLACDCWFAAADQTNLMQYYPFVRGPASTVVDKLEANTEAELLARIEQE